MVYLDNASTSYPKPPEVVEAVREGLSLLGGNPGRSAHRLAEAAEGRIREVREALARFLGVRDSSRVVFTLNATDALNMALKGVLRPGDHVVATALEHTSVLRPLRAMERDGRIELGVAGFGRDGKVDVAALRRLLRPNTRMVAVVHVSNVLGTVQPVAALAEAAREAGALLLVDAAQSGGILSLEETAAVSDLLALTGHKGLCGPMGVGALVLGERARDEVRAWREGGTGDGGELQPSRLPGRLEAGTPNVPGISGLGAGLAYVAGRGTESLLEHERRLACALWEGARDTGGIRTLQAGPPETGIVSLLVDGYAPDEAAAALDASYGIACRSGLHCAPEAHRALGTAPEGAIRFSFGPLSGEEDAARALEALAALARA